MACTGALPRSSLSPHSLNQLLMIVFPFGSRGAVCTLENLYSGESAAVHSQTVSPLRLISRTNLSPAPEIRTFPFLSGAADQQFATSLDQSTLPSRSYSTTLCASMCATRMVPAAVNRAWRNCPCTLPGFFTGSSNWCSILPLAFCITTNFAGFPFWINRSEENTSELQSLR